MVQTGKILRNFFGLYFSLDLLYNGYAAVLCQKIEYERKRECEREIGMCNTYNFFLCVKKNHKQGFGSDVYNEYISDVYKFGAQVKNHILYDFLTCVPNFDHTQ